jgi:shikimate dehydrogenase
MEAVSRVWQLEELARAELPAVPLAVLGDPVAHSLSPAMHQAALADLARADPAFADWGYVAVRVPLEELSRAVEELHHLGFRGLNLTIPHKVRAVDLVRAVEPEARAMGAVNTLMARAGGYVGTNTDGWGIARAVKERLGRALGADPVVLCGAGGAARAIAVRALRDGVPELWIGNRGPENLATLLEQLRAADLDLARVRTFLFARPPAELPAGALVINATAAGLRGDDRLPLDLDFLGAEGALYDTTYGVENAWARFAASRNLPYADGLSMLVAQGARSLELWTGRAVSAEVMARAARETLALRAAAS